MIQWMNVNVVPPRRSHLPTQVLPFDGSADAVMIRFSAPPAAKYVRRGIARSTALPSEEPCWIRC